MLDAAARMVTVKAHLKCAGAILTRLLALQLRPLGVGNVAVTSGEKAIERRLLMVFL